MTITPSKARAAFLEQASQRILITDGAFGTQIQTKGLVEADYAGDLGLTKDQKARITCSPRCAFTASATL